MPDSGWPDAATSAALHARLLAGDPLAPSDFAAAVLGPLAASLERDSRGVDEHLWFEAAESALIDLIREPSKYDPARGELPAFLRLIARRDLLNLLARERKHHDRRERSDSVELAPDGRNNSTRGEDSDRPSLDGPELAAAIAGFTDVERRVFELMRAGERRTEVFAAALGIADRPAGEQRSEVYRTKDRIMTRLKRAGRGS
jgi:DNA-directed RNA polymerase specialized sigma24 family protein